MGDFSRDSFKQTQNILNDLRGLTPAPQPSPKHYVSIRLQQGVPLLDADWNEQDDIRRIELETMLVRAIGNGAPAGSNGFQIQEAGINNDFFIEAGLLFLDGWLVYNGSRVDYINQPHRNSPGVSPPLPTLQNAPAARRELVYLDAWEPEINSQRDGNLVDPNIGVETCTRIERAWVARMETIANAADPLNPATIPNRRPGHRYYPLAAVNRPAGGQISAAMITDLRRTHLTLEALTYAPLFIYNPALDQTLNSARLAGAFRGNLDAMQDLLLHSPQIFVYTGHEPETWQAMTAFQDVRASATSFEQQASNQLLHRQAAGGAMNSFYQIQRRLMNLLQQFITAGGITGAPTQSFVTIYRAHLQGTPPTDPPTDPQSLAFALAAGDLLGAVMAQERLNEALALESNTLPEGTVTASLIAITPTGNLQANTNYQLTIRIQSNLTSAQGSEPIRAIASAGLGWTLGFVGTTQPNPREIVVTVLNQQTQNIVLSFSAPPGTANTTLSLTVRPERRQQLVYNHPPVTLALGQQVLPATVLATLDYQGPQLQPGNIAQVPRSVMAQAGGVPIPFGVTNLSAASEQYQITVTAIDPVNGTPVAAAGWQAPNQPVLAPFNPAGSPTNTNRNVNLNFRITNQAGAVSPLTYRIQLVRVTGGANEPLTNVSARFDLTFNLTAG